MDTSKVTDIKSAIKPEIEPTPGQQAAFLELNNLKAEFNDSGANAPDHVILIFKKPNGQVGFFTNEGNLIEKAGMLSIATTILHSQSLKG
jgi:hypothetical protein